MLFESMIKKRGFLLAIVGLVCGIGMGFATLAIERRIARELTALLEEEAEKACACGFSAEEITFSLFTLSAWADKARVLAENGTSLEFNLLEADFSLRKIRDRKILLTQLNLVDGFARGVGENSAAFQFIDHLAKPLPPEKDKPGRWKLKLQSLKVKKSRFVEKLKDGRLVGSNVNLHMARDAQNNFVLKPAIGNLAFRFKTDTNKKRTISFGNVKSSILILDDRTIFKNLALSFRKSLATINATAFTDLGNQLKGELTFRVAADLLQISDWFKGELLGKGLTGGTLGSPTFSGDLKLGSDQNGVVSIGGQALTSFSTLKGSYDFDYNEGDYLLEIKQLQGQSKTSQLALVSPLSISEDTVAGKLQLQIGSYVNGSVELQDLDLLLSLSGSVDTPLLDVSGSLSQVLLPGYSLPGVNFTLTGEPDKLSLDLVHQSSDGGSLKVSGSLKQSTKRKGREIEQLDFVLDNFSIFPTNHSTPTATLLNKLRISGKGQLSGGPHLSDIEGQASLRLASRHFAGEAALKGTATFSDSQAQIRVFNESNSIDANLSVSFAESEEALLEINLTNFKPAEYQPNLRCLSTTAKALYRFQFQELLKGFGKVELKKLALGCSPYQIQLTKPVNAKIDNGLLKLSDLPLSGTNTFAKVNGTLSFLEGLDLQADGSFHLNALLALLPELDDLEGLAEANLSISGPLNEPQIEGQATIKNAALASEAMNSNADSINGELVFAGNKVTIRNLAGYLNNGEFTLGGTVLPFQ